MSFDTKFYEEVYDSLGKDFHTHLEAGDLHLYKNKSTHWLGRLFSQSNENDSSIEVAKKIIMKKVAPYLPQITSSSEPSLIIDPLFEIAKISAARDGRAITLHLDKYAITDPIKRFEIAKIAAAQNGSVVSENIAKYNLTDKEQLFEIAKIVANKSGRAISENLANFGITDKLHLFEIAKIAAEQNGKFVTEYFANYGLSDPKQIYKIAKIAAKNNGAAVAENLANYKISDPAKLFKLAKIIAPSNSWAISQHLAKFNLNEDQRFEIAEITAGFAGTLSRCISNYNLNEIQRFRIAAIIAPKDGEFLCRDFANFHITDANLRFEIAKIVAQVRNRISYYLANFDLSDNHRFEIAKIAALIVPREVANHIINYNLTESQRFEIAKIIAKNSLISISEVIANFDLMLFERLEVAKIAMERYSNRNMFETIVLNGNTFPQSAPEKFLKFILENTKLNEIKSFAKSEIDLFENYPEINLLSERELTTEEIKKFLTKSCYYATITSLVDDICAQKSSFIRKPLIQHLGLFLFHCQHKNIQSEYLKKGMPIIKELFDIKDVDFRLTSLPNVVNTFQSEERIEKWNNLFNLADKKPFTAIMCLYLAPLLQEEEKKPIADIIKTRNFQDTNFRKPFIRNLEKISDTTNYSTENKQLIFSNFVLLPPLSVNSIIKNTQNVTFLFSFDKKQILLSANPKQGLDPVISNIFSEYLAIDNIENSAERFQKTFGSSPYPDAIFRYAKTLMKLNYDRDSYISCLRLFASSVLEGKFPAMRYDTTNNLHLQTIFNTPERQKLKEEWEKGAVYEDLFTSDSVIKQKEKIFDGIEFFRTAILNDNHLPKDNFPDLLAVLSDPNEKDKIIKNLKLKLENKDRFRFEKLTPLELKGLKQLCLDAPFSEEDIEKKIKELTKDLKRLSKSKIDKINPSQLQRLKAMYPEGPPSKEEIAAKVKNLTEAFKKENEIKIKKICSFQLQVVNLMYPDQPLSSQDIEGKLNSLLKTLNDLYPQKSPELSEDLAKAIQAIQLPPATRQVSRYAGWTVSDTDDPYTLLVLGTDVPGKSCQDVDGNADYAKCLLSYLIDGKNRAIVVKDNKGKMRARAIFRLLWDKKTDKAVLFLEHTYPKYGLDPAVAKAIEKAAMHRSASLNLDLLSDKPTNRLYPNTIFSLGGRAPSEYVDSGGGVETPVFSLERKYYLE